MKNWEEEKNVYHSREVSSIEYLTGFDPENTVLKKSFLASLLVFIVLLWVVFPESYAEPGKIDQKPVIIDNPWKPKIPKKPSTNVIKVKRKGRVMPDSKPNLPEPEQDYEWDDDGDDNPMNEYSWTFDPGEDQGPIVAGGKVRMPECYERVLPEYPDIASAAGVNGVVVLKVIINRDGLIRKAEVLSSPGKQFGFDEAALEAVKHWKCHPATLDDRKVEVIGTITINFLVKR